MEEIVFTSDRTSPVGQLESGGHCLPMTDHFTCLSESHGRWDSCIVEDIVCW